MSGKSFIATLNPLSLDPKESNPNFLFSQADVVLSVSCNNFFFIAGVPHRAL